MNQLNLFLEISLASLAGAQATWILAHRFKMHSIRAASLASLIFVGLAYFTGNDVLLALQPAFFGSTYVAMSEPRRMSEIMVMLAGFLFGIVFFALQLIDFIHFRGGMGGTLGGAAFISCVIVSSLRSLFKSRLTD